MIRAHVATRFPLRGTHRAIDCEDCHSAAGPGSLQYVKTPVDCVACHLDSYLSTIDPDHQAEGFPQTCESCHSTQAWLPAGFNHALLAPGAVCASCHLDDYRNASWHENDLFHNVNNGDGTKFYITGGFKVPADGQLVSLDCGACHNQFTFALGVYLEPR